MAQNKGILGIKYGSVEPYKEGIGIDFLYDRC